MHGKHSIRGEGLIRFLTMLPDHNACREILFCKKRVLRKLFYYYFGDQESNDFCSKLALLWSTLIVDKDKKVFWKQYHEGISVMDINLFHLLQTITSIVFLILSIYLNIQRNCGSPFLTRKN